MAGNSGFEGFSPPSECEEKAPWMAPSGLNPGPEARSRMLRAVGQTPSSTPSAPVAHLDRVMDFESIGSRFESCRVHNVSSLSLAGFHGIVI